MNKTFYSFLLVWVRAKKHYHKRYIGFPREGTATYSTLRQAWQICIKYDIPFQTYLDAQLQHFKRSFPHAAQLVTDAALTRALELHDNQKAEKEIKDPYKKAKATHRRRMEKYKHRWQTFSTAAWNEDDWCIGPDNDNKDIVLYRLDKYWYHKMKKRKLRLKLKRRLKELSKT